MVQGDPQCFCQGLHEDAELKRRPACLDLPVQREHVAIMLRECREHVVSVSLVSLVIMTRQRRGDVDGKARTSPLGIVGVPFEATGNGMRPWDLGGRTVSSSQSMLEGFSHFRRGEGSPRGFHCPLRVVAFRSALSTRFLPRGVGSPDRSALVV